MCAFRGLCATKIKSLSCPEKWSVKTREQLPMPVQIFPLNGSVLMPILTYLLCGILHSFMAYSRLRVWHVSDLYYQNAIPGGEFRIYPKLGPSIGPLTLTNPYPVSKRYSSWYSDKIVIPSIHMKKWRHSWDTEVS